VCGLASAKRYGALRIDVEVAATTLPAPVSSPSGSSLLHEHPRHMNTEPALPLSGQLLVNYSHRDFEQGAQRRYLTGH
jgi:hypothetical protein